MRLLKLPMGEEVPEDETLYSTDEKGGHAWRGFMWLQRHFLVPFLVGAKIPKSHYNKSSMDAVLAQAEEARRGVTATPGSNDTLKRQSPLAVTSVRRHSLPMSSIAGEIFALFGTDD